MIPLLLLAILATDVAVAVMYVSLRRTGAAAGAGSLDASLAGEMEELVQDLRDQAEQAAAELARQKAHLRRMLSDVERRQAEVSFASNPTPAAARPAARPAPAPAAATGAPTRRDILRLAAEGLPLRAIAARTGLSTEEVRLMLAMAEEAA